MSRPESRTSMLSTTSRQRTSSHPSRPPLESLVYALVPSLAPPRTRTGDAEQEKERKDKVREVMEFCEEIMESRLPSSTPLAASTLSEAVRRLLLQSAGSDKALRFGGLWNKLERGRTLASPQPHLQFLLALSRLDPKNAPPHTSSAASTHRSGSRKAADPTSSSAVFPSTQEPTASSSRRVLEDTGTINVSPSHWSGKGKSKADVLKAWRTARSQPPFPTHLLLRDTLYLLQGIDGRYVRFAVDAAKGSGGGEAEEEVVGIEIVADEAKDGYITTPTPTLLVQLSEMGVMYRRVTDFVQSRQSSGKGSMTEQSLCHFLHHELSEYHRLLAVLESQLSLTAPTTPAPPAEGALDGPRPAEGAGLTLMRLGLWTEEMKLKMRMMNQVVDDAKAAHGGALVSRIHSHTSHGDPFVRRFMDQILEEVSKPFFSTLERWIFSGELHDPFNEFFVQLNPEASLREGRISPYHSGDAGFEGGAADVGGGSDEAGKVWEKKYVFVKGMVPGFVSEEFGKKIFSTGRSLNFIRYSCQDTDWIETQAKLANAGQALKYSDLAGLERSIDDAYSIASQRLLEIFFDKFVLLDHLRALKSYLMLGAGDFTELLMEALAPRLSKQAISLYRHHLTSDLESAIRGSNAQYDNPDILRRLDARVLEYSHGELGWDCFALEYKVEAPLNAVLDAKAMAEYDRLFHHLWRLKRVESALTQGWMRVTSGSRMFEKLPTLSNDWHHCRIVQAEMVHFLRQLQAFCQLEVIECSWQSLVDFTSKREGDLDALIQAHRTYLSRVVRKALLLGSKRDKEEILLDLVRDALDYVLQFRDATDDLYGWSLGEATRLDRERDAERPFSSRDSADTVLFRASTPLPPGSTTRSVRLPNSARYASASAHARSTSKIGSCRSVT
ncbi:Microtubule-nucleating Tub4p (gamma-tubulin) complex component [Saitozyma podzolica]|uniref:Microtubule-nucleating Tub4p (Gamma-tubulin) complex component n=1 Tax=Saitozyma podzolica TaxID=1890683 RepID=A0A427YUI2_9TREE|nr:Microtubule-nucleating Tub4p (gamma-tubulin) complex component [Saitozyma podzolica]